MRFAIHQFRCDEPACPKDAFPLTIFCWKHMPKETKAILIASVVDWFPAFDIDAPSKKKRKR